MLLQAHIRIAATGLLIGVASIAGLGCDDSGPSTDAEDVAQSQQDTAQNEPVEAQSQHVDWFSSYNEGQGTDYLGELGLVVEEGDVVRYPNAVAHTFVEDVAYGPFSRNVLDLWVPTDAASPMPVVVYIHGGGFTSGDKDKLHQGKADVEAYLEQGIAVASANYRYGSKSDEAALRASRPNGVCDGTDDGCRRDYTFRDGARVIQFLRYASASLGIDPDRIGVWGSSAGGQIALWLATAPDLAMADHPDPVLRQSTRVRVVGHASSQVSAHLSDWPLLLDFSDAFWDALGWGDMDVDQALHSTTAELRDSEQGQALKEIVDYYGAITADDPPIITTGSVSDHTESELLDPANAEAAQDWFVHHPQQSTPVYEKCLSVKEECAIATNIIHAGPVVDPELSANQNVQAFLTHWLTR